MDTIQQKEEGQGLVEYALILVLVAVVVIGVLTILGPRIAVTYARIMGGFSGQSITMSGNEVLVIGADIQKTSSGGGCNFTISGTALVGLQDGNILTNQSVTAQVQMNGVDLTGVTLSATANGNGLADLNGATATANNVDCGKVTFVAP